MAKRKKSSQLISLITVASCILGLVAVVMMFLPAIGVKDSDKTFTGLQIAFGYATELDLGITKVSTTIFNFSFMNLLTYILALAGTVVALLGLVGKNFAGALFRFVAAGCFIVSAVFFFLSLNFCLPNDTASSVMTFLGGNIKEIGTLAAGSIIGGCAAGLAGLCELAAVFVK